MACSVFDALRAGKKSSTFSVICDSNTCPASQATSPARLHSFSSFSHPTGPNNKVIISFRPKKRFNAKSFILKFFCLFCTKWNGTVLKPGSDGYSEEEEKDNADEKGISVPLPLKIAGKKSSFSSSTLSEKNKKVRRKNKSQPHRMSTPVKRLFKLMDHGEQRGRESLGPDNWAPVWCRFILVCVCLPSRSQDALGE